MTRHHAVGAAVLTVALMGAGSSTAVAKTPTSPGALRQALPLPGKATLAGTTEFVGSSGNVNIALVRTSGGAVVAYVCDGKRLSRWFGGRVKRNRATLIGTAARLRATLSGTIVSGTAFVDGRTVRFTLNRARRGVSGLRRLTDTFDAKPLEAGWITTNAGRIRGAGTSGGVVLFSTSVSVTDPSTNDSGELSTPGGKTGSEIDPTLLRRARCAALLVRIGAARADRLQNGDSPTITQTLKDLQSKFGALDCDDFFSQL